MKEPTTEHARLQLETQEKPLGGERQEKTGRWRQPIRAERASRARTGRLVGCTALARLLAMVATASATLPERRKETNAAIRGGGPEQRAGDGAARSVQRLRAAAGARRVLPPGVHAV